MMILEVGMHSMRHLVRIKKKLKHYLCTWHIDKNWKRNLVKKVGLAQRRTEIYHQLYFLRTMLDLSKFEWYYTNFINGLDKEELFRNYFVDNYGSEDRKQKWGHCFRDTEIIFTTSHIENYHRLLKRVFFKGKRNRKVSLLLHVLMRKVEPFYFKKYSVRNRIIEPPNSKLVKLSDKIFKARKMIGSCEVFSDNLGHITIGGTVAYKVCKRDLFEDFGCKKDCDFFSNYETYEFNNKDYGDVYNFASNSSTSNDLEIETGDLEDDEAEANILAPCGEPPAIMEYCFDCQIVGMCRHQYCCTCPDYGNGHTCKHVLLMGILLGRIPKSGKVYSNLKKTFAFDE